jgi:hypothetical protein
MGTRSPSRGRPGRPTSAVTTLFYYQHTADRASRALKGVDEPVAKAEHAVTGRRPVKRYRFVKLTGADRSVNRAL